MHSLEVALHVVDFVVSFTIVLKGNIDAIKKSLSSRLIFFL